MAKRKILVSNEQVKETRLINSLNSNLLKKEDEKTNSIKEESPVEENFINVREKTLAELAETEPAANAPQDELPGPYAANACNCGTEIVEDNAPSFDKVETDRQRKIKYDAHADKIGYADAPTSPTPDNTMVFKDLSPEAMEKLKTVISPVANSILERLEPEKIATGKDAEYEMVNHPSHYNQYDIEVIDMIIKIWGPEAAALWCDITAFKYRMRMGTKPDNSIEQDIKKEQWYLNKAREIRASIVRENLINKN